MNRTAVNSASGASEYRRRLSKRSTDEIMDNQRPKLLDLFCGAGGCSVGYHRAGFDVTGVDIKPQPRYPFEFVRANALEYLAEHGCQFDAIHASPPCQPIVTGKQIQ